MVFDPGQCAHLPVNELKIDWLSELLISSPMLMIDHTTHDHTEVFSLSNMLSSEVFFHSLAMHRFVNKRSSSSVDLANSSEPSSLDDVQAERAAIALAAALETCSARTHSPPP